MMNRYTHRLIAIDLGTTSTTVKFVAVHDSFDQQGNLHRKQVGKATAVKDWPSGRHGETIGNLCLPTDMIYLKANRKLIAWGFQATKYFKDLDPSIPHEAVYTVRNLKLLLQGPGEQASKSSARYCSERENLRKVLRKEPFEVFQEFLDEVLSHVLSRSRAGEGLQNCHIELILAFPSGWPNCIHKKVAEKGANAVRKALIIGKFQNVSFGIENVYTVSETLCGTMEWLKEADLCATVNGERNVGDLNEGDLFLTIDVGGGTGCMTLLKLTGQSPIRVDQVSATRSLDVCGEAVDVEVETRIKDIIKPENLIDPRKLDQVVNQVCREIREEKKSCGEEPDDRQGMYTCPCWGLKVAIQNGLPINFLKIPRQILYQCFDTVLDLLQAVTIDRLRECPAIQGILFLGEFGGSSLYLRERMDEIQQHYGVKIWYSSHGKMNVVEGALNTRMKLSERFVRRFRLRRSYGMLVSIPYEPGDLARRIFRCPIKDGAVPFEKKEGKRLKVINWVFSKGTDLSSDNIDDSGTCGTGPLQHTWSIGSLSIDFEDVIIVSDELPPSPHPDADGESYTLWTKAHEKNRLGQFFDSGERFRVEQVPFKWNLSMSQKLNQAGKDIGPFKIDDLDLTSEDGVHTERELFYYLLWEITEMQVKVHVKAIFPRHNGPLATQLAKERQIHQHDIWNQESRSADLEKDIHITHQAVQQTNFDVLGSPSDLIISQGRDATRVVSQANTRQRVRMRASRYLPLREVSPETNTSGDTLTVSEIALTASALNPTSTVLLNSGHDDRRRDLGCYTCKNIGLRCDGILSNHDGPNENTPKVCRRCYCLELPCERTKSGTVNGPSQEEALEEIRRRDIRTGKKRARDVSDSSWEA